MKKFLILISLFLTLSSFAFADDQTTVPPDVSQPAVVQKPAAAEINPKTGRSKSLSFDDSVVEGLNQNSKDSLEMVEKNDGRSRQHLYQKKADFKKEIQNFPSELGYSP